MSTTLSPSTDIVDAVTPIVDEVTETEIIVDEIDINDTSDQEIILQMHLENCCCECCVTDYLETETYLFERFF